MRALLLCAGAGSRLAPLTDVCPKPLVTVAGVPLVLRQILALKAAGVTSFVINVAHAGALLRATLGDGSAWGVHITWSVEGETISQALETLGGIVKALPLLTAHGDDAFIVAAGDVVTDYPWERLCARGAALKAEGALAHLVLVENPDYHPSGDMTLREGLVSREVKTHTFASFGVYRAALFEGLTPARASLFPWLDAAVAQGRLTGEVYDGLWLNVGDFRELARARERLKPLGGWPPCAKGELDAADIV